MYLFVALLLMIGVPPGRQETTNPGAPRCKLSAGFVQTPLMLAIWHGDLKTVKLLVTSATNLNTVFPMTSKYNREVFLTTPLTYAIHAKNAWNGCPHSGAIVEFLLANKADPNFHAPDGLTPLQMSASFGDVSSVRILLQHKARLEDRKYNGETALLIAAQQENGAAVIQELVAAGANTHTLNDLGSNAIMLAAWQHHLENVKLLIQLGVDPCAKNKAGESAVDEAESNLNDDPGKREIITFLQTKCNR